MDEARGKARSGLAALTLALAGCAGGVPLRTPTTFTPKAVKAIQYDDVCKLQDYYDARPPPWTVLQSVVTSTSAQKGARGKLTLRVLPGAQRKALLRILGTFYRRDPRLRFGKAPELTLPFFEHRGRRHLPIGAAVRIKTRSGMLALAYHPCLGELFFGRRTYEARRLLFTPARRRAQPPPKRRQALPPLPR